MSPQLMPSFQPYQPDPDRPGIVVLMSGGVDSSVTAALLREGGWNVVGLTMLLPLARNPAERGCCGADAALVCHALGLPHYYLDLREAFSRCVIAPFQADYAAGRTPSPCVSCNELLKFGQAWEAAERELGLSELATGHYARIRRDGAGCRLARASQGRKDQSSWLYRIPPARLPHLHLPLGDHAKHWVRQTALQMGLRVAEKPESMELCFAAAGDYRTALGPEADRPGPVVDSSGRVLGQHRGLRHYTIGQRKGLGIAGREPLFVIALHPGTDTVVLGNRAEAHRTRVYAHQPCRLQPTRCHPGSRLRGMVRANALAQPCAVIADDLAGLSVDFDPPVFAPAPGQHLVLYDEDDCIVAGGVIAGEPEKTGG